METFRGLFGTRKNGNGKESSDEGSSSIELQDTSTEPTASDSTPNVQSTSEPSSLSSPSSKRLSYPSGDFRNAAAEEVNEIKCDLIVKWLHSRQEENLWTNGQPDEGVVLKKSRGSYTCCPSDLEEVMDGFFQGIARLNVKCAMTINTPVVQVILKKTNLPYVEIETGLQVQVLNDISELHRCQKHQSAAFIADRGILVIWEDDSKKILRRAEEFQDKLVRAIWTGTTKDPNTMSEEEMRELVNRLVIECDDPEAQIVVKPRSIMLIQPILVAITLIITICAIGGGLRLVAIEIAVDRGWARLAFLAAAVPQIWLALFFFQCVVGNVAQVIGPIRQIHVDSKYYSAQSPRRLRRKRGDLPHVTIQCPVYKEGLRSVIEPTMRSLKDAISTYEMQGGTANIFINDDGMQLISEQDARARQEFYDEGNIGWVARPKHNPKPDDGEIPFIRRGKFKKASNMNYALWISTRVEEKLESIERTADWSSHDEAAAYEEALNNIINEDEGRTWANGNIRMGDYILLVDSDTRVPQDCLLDAVSEMELSPQVAIIQYTSGVMNVTNSFFERAITFFTNLIYTQIRYSVANGDVAPFVGHNAVLRWSAIQEIAYDCPLDSRQKFWSESTVSEDFDMSLRLQTEGYHVRLASYTKDGFKEGVSLTVYDELARWEKYAFGCSELIFHPLSQWLAKGPFTKLFRKFVASNMPIGSKVTIMSYIGTYYALGSAWVMTLLNFFAVGWYNGMLDAYYIDSFKIYFAIICVFTLVGNFSLAFVRYRLRERTLTSALLENVLWIPIFIVFFGGLSLHVSQALLSHLFGVDMTWGATAKEAENITFFDEIPRVIKRFRGTFAFCIACIAIIVVCAYALPVFWRIDFFTAIYPLASIVFCHALLPTALNPNLMRFTW